MIFQIKIKFLILLFIPHSFHLKVLDQPDLFTKFDTNEKKIDSYNLNHEFKQLASWQPEIKDFMAGFKEREKDNQYIETKVVVGSVKIRNGKIVKNQVEEKILKIDKKNQKIKKLERIQNENKILRNHNQVKPLHKPKNQKNMIEKNNHHQNYNKNKIQHAKNETRKIEIIKKEPLKSKKIINLQNWNKFKDVNKNNDIKIGKQLNRNLSQDVGNLNKSQEFRPIKIAYEISFLKKNLENISQSKHISSIKDYIEKDSKGSQYIITSRIDNDDCIHKDYITSIQSQFKSQNFMAIDVLKGYSLQISPDIMLGKKEHIFNPFISLIEKNDAPKTVWFSDHNMWKKESRRVEIANKRLWMSIIHEKNKVNEFDGYDNVDWDLIKNQFIVSKTIEEKVSNDIIPHKKWRTLSLKNKLYVNYVLASKKFKKALGLYKIK